jgi:hypothetical protein
MLLSSDAQHAKEVALAERDRVRALALQEREQRAKALKEKQVRCRSARRQCTRWMCSPLLDVVRVV